MMPGHPRPDTDGDPGPCGAGPGGLEAGRVNPGIALPDDSLVDRLRDQHRHIPAALGKAGTGGLGAKQPDHMVQRRTRPAAAAPDDLASMHRRHHPQPRLRL